MNPNRFFRHLALGAACAIALSASAQVTINIDAASRGPVIGDRHYGIFFEEINHAGDGGLYAELVRNRSFEDNASTPEYWTALGTSSQKLVTSGLLNNVQNRALQVTFGKEGDAVKNAGFWGMNIVKDTDYQLTFWMKADAFTGDINGVLIGANGADMGMAKAAKVQDGKDGWAKYAATITATASDAKGGLALRATKAGTATFDVVSLFPPTYKNRPNGCRPDLAQMLADMHPAFMRFPGGCFVEGTQNSGSRNRFEWKNTIGPIEERPGHLNVNWGYRVSDGLGFHEMLVLGEDLGAEPLFVVNIGMGHGWSVPYDAIGEFIQEALDAIEYCNGDVTTTWGAVRAAAGHPEPFNLRLIEVGNENYQANPNEQSDHYAERYKQFYDAIRAKYPDMVIIGNVEAWGTDTPSWRNPYPVDAVDEHYYRNPSWFVNQYSKYDSRDRSLPKVYAGEYAVTSDFGTTGHLAAALGEAVYMLGMENNSDVCIMNSYAPIFVNENDQRWMPDMIRFSSNQAYGTPSYYVQQLLPNNHGKQNVRWTEEGNFNQGENHMGLSTWSTTAKFDNVKVTGADGQTIFADDFAANSGAWTAAGGSWSVSGGTLNQTDAGMQGAINLCSAVIGDTYTIELEATKTGGAEGFLIAFNYTDARNYCWWNLGGWGNTQHAVEMCVDGAKSTVAAMGGTLENNHAYKIKIVVAGAAVKCYLDGELKHDFTLPIQRSLYVASSIDDDAKMMYVKLVNTGSKAVNATINMASADMTACTATILSSANATDENTTANPYKVAPVEDAPAVANAKQMTYTVPAYALCILRIALDNIAAISNDPMTDAEKATVAEDLQAPMTKFNFLHAAATLPSGTKGGASIAWTIKQTQAGYVDLSDAGLSQTLEVNKQPSAIAEVATLVANVAMPNGHKGTIEYPVKLAPADTEYGYLYCFMNPAHEITNYALGNKEDMGMRFNVLIDGREVFDTYALAEVEHGTRDAYLGRGQRPDEYFMTTTDMKQAVSGVWDNYAINLLRSRDLIHWESTTFDFRKGKKIFSDPEATDAAYKTDAEYAKIHRVWAPQFIWDPTVEKYLVYYSILSSNPGDNADKIYYSYADKDFKTLTQPRLFFYPGLSVIDGDIVYNPYDGLYHMFYKREGANGAERGIWKAVSDKLVGGIWKEMMHITNEGTEQVEGSSAVRRINEDAYNLYYMRYSGGSAYKVCALDHSCMNASGSSNLQGNGNFQHGSVITISKDEYTVLQAWSDIILLMEQLQELKKTTGTTIFDAAFAKAEQALKGTSVSTLAIDLPAALDDLKNAQCDYIEASISDEGETDLTHLIVNHDLSKKQTGWLGTEFTAANGYVAEHFDKNFDTYQVIELMPAGVYRFEAQGFYRFGSKTDAPAAHANGTEQLHAVLYINEASTPFMSLYDSSVPYTLSPYTYPDNVTTANSAFVKGQYADNSVVVVLPERGSLRFGVRKEVLVGTDWTIFDNFKLTCISKDPASVAAIVADADAPVDVYNAAGIRVRQGVDAASAAAGLAPGLYIIGTQKVLIK